MFNQNSLLGTLKRSLNVLEKKDRRFLALILLISSLFTLLDLFAIGLVGLLGALSVSGVQSQVPTGRALQVLEFMNLDQFSFQNQVCILGLVTVFALLIRTIVSATLMKRVFSRLAKKGSEISSDLFGQINELDLSQVKQIGMVNIVTGLNAGVNSMVLGVIGTSIAIGSELVLLLVMMFGLFIIDPASALLILLFLVAGALTINFFLTKKIRGLSTEEARLNIESDEDAREFVNSFREIRVYGKSEKFHSKYSDRRTELSNVIAELTLMPNLTKYYVESAVIILAIMFSAFQFVINDAKQAIASLGVLILVSTRVVPSLLRIQQSSLFIKRSAAVASKTLDLATAIAFNPNSKKFYESKKLPHEGSWSAMIELNKVSFRYSDSSVDQLTDISLKISEGEFVAIVGPSGAGKSTLVDLILGILTPSKGAVFISGMTPEQALKANKGKVAYVSQITSLINGSLLENITFEREIDVNGRLNLDRALKGASLENLIESLDRGLETTITDSENLMSVGQRQRVGIARALFVNPTLLIMDEPTSALDAQTERAISDSINTLRGKSTIVVIAHRLSTITNADRILYLDNGMILHEGTFESLRATVPNFDEQARLLGL